VPCIKAEIIPISPDAGNAAGGIVYCLRIVGLWLNLNPYRMKISEQIVVVTGAGRGLGAAIARSFAREGARVVINYYKSQEKAEQLAASLGDKAIALQADVRSAEEVKQLFRKAEAHFGKPVSTVINNALINFSFNPTTRKDASQITWQAYQEQMEGTVQAALNTLQAALPGMKQQNFGRLINIGTNLLQNPVVAYHEYTTAKAALLGFTRNMANELGASGITVNMVSGGLLRTTDASSATTPEVFGIVESITPLRKVTEPEEVADAVLFFASPWARAVTGQNLVVDGGLVMD
jgi:3-oxoacyl-[acyl-carrier protein] reductase